MLDDTNPCATFENRLQEALISSAAEHGKCFDDLELRFGVVQGAGVFIGSELRTPILQSIGELGKIRGILEPFRELPTRIGAAGGHFGCIVLHICSINGYNFRRLLQIPGELQVLIPANFYENPCPVCSTSGLRDKHLRAWECKHMALQDKKRRYAWDMTNQNEKNGGRIGLQRSELRRAKQLQAWERKSMCLEDKNRTSTPKVACAYQEATVSQCCSEKEFICFEEGSRWDGNGVEKDAQWIEKQRRKLLRERNRDREAQRRAQVLAQQHAKKEERLRREAWRKEKQILLSNPHSSSRWPI